MSTPVDLRMLTPADEMQGETPADAEELRQMLRRAEEYLKSFPWCPPIIERRLGVGIPGVIALFLFRLNHTDGIDDWLWVVDGDLPSAYFVVDDAPDAASALAVYCDLMDAWAESVINERLLDNVFPVRAAATKENGRNLLRRTRFIRDQIIPTL